MDLTDARHASSIPDPAGDACSFHALPLYLPGINGPPSPPVVRGISGRYAENENHSHNGAANQRRAEAQLATLDRVLTGRTVRLAGTSVHNGVLLRLAEMGMTTGALVAVTRRAPLGDPIEI